MKIESRIYLYTPLESDFGNREEIREHLARVAGRLFLKKNDDQQWTIPFSSICHLISILNEVNSKDVNELDFTIDVGKFYKNSMKVMERRSLRIQLEDVDPRYDARRFRYMLPKTLYNKDLEDHFSDETIGSITLMDADHDYKFKKLYFDNFFEAGIAISKVYAAEVYNRIPLQEPSNV